MKKLVALFLYLIMYFGPLWYKLRYLFIKPIKHQPIKLEANEIESKLDAIIKNFIYTADGAKELADAIVPPDYALYQLQNNKLFDDCDGFHAAAYELIRNAGYKTALVTSLNDNVMSNHVMVLFEHNRNLYLVNYNTVKNVFNGVIDNLSPQEFNNGLKTLFTKECASQSRYMFGTVFTKSRWFKRINLYKFFKK
jgi:hypothetical protein